MGPKSVAYLEQFERKLEKFPEDERKDVVQEIRGHIEERLLQGQLEVTILANLGDPKKLAKAYTGDYYLHRSKPSVLQMFSIGSYYVGSSILSMMVIPLLFTVALGFLFCAIVAIPLGVLDTLFEFSWIEIGSSVLPRSLYIPVTVLISLASYIIYYLSKKALKAYLKFLSFTHRRVTS